MKLAASLAVAVWAAAADAKFMRCGDGVPLCGVLALESGLGRNLYHHSMPVVHGLWPQVDHYGSSKCIRPKHDGQTRKLYSCYAEGGGSRNRVLWFEGHEWSKHGRCAGAYDEDDFFAQVCALSSRPLDVMEEAMEEGFGAMVAALRRAGLPVYSVDSYNDQIELSACAGQDGRWKIAAVDRFQEVCGARGQQPPPPRHGVCVPNRHGPRCHSDSQCAGLPGCARCARSGYCTNLPLMLELEEASPRLPPRSTLPSIALVVFLGGGLATGLLAAAALWRWRVQQASPWVRWLLAVDSSGGLLRYKGVIEDNYDGVDQIEDLYVAGEGGSKKLDPQFFEDLEIQDTKHQALFTKFYCGDSSPARAPPPEHVAPPESSKAEEKASKKEAQHSGNDSAFARWLLAVDSNSRLLCYQKEIEDNYDGVDQIEDLYVSTVGGIKKFDPQFFEDNAIKDSAHQALFARFYCGDAAAPPAEQAKSSESEEAAAKATSRPAALGTAGASPIGRWLLEVDAGGALLRYRQAIEDNYDGVDQIEDLYVSGEPGQRVLDREFFEDMSIEDVAHQALFTKFYEGCSSVSPAGAPLRAQPSETLAAAEKAVEKGLPAPASGSPFARWLLAIDSSGGLMRYKKVIEDNYDGVGQIEDLYVSSQGAQKRRLEPLFFRDAGIDDPAHQALFAAFYGAAAAPQAAPPPPAAAAAAAVAAARPPPAEGGSALAQWLLELDASGGLLRYRRGLEDNYDGVDQIKDLYLQGKGSGGGSLDPQFFEDVGIEDPKHAELFRSWASSLPSRGAPAPPAAEPAAALAAVPAAAAPVAAAQAPGVPGTVAAWLREMDPGGSLDSYCKLFEDNFDDVEQIRDLYIIEKDGKKVFDPQMFEDVGIEDKGQQALFEAWFAKVVKVASQSSSKLMVPAENGLPEGVRPSGAKPHEEQEVCRNAAPPRRRQRGPDNFGEEQQEWYQKWLRRQESRPVAPSSQWKEDQSPIDPNQERWCSDDEAWYTFPRLKAKYADDYSEEELEEFWRRQCKPRWVKEQEERFRKWEQEEKSKPVEDQDWYQKWLRRQEGRPKGWAGRQDQEADSDERRLDPHDGEWRTFRQTQDKYQASSSQEEIEGYWHRDMKPEWKVKEDEAKPKEEQEWYQKWLRRQENRPPLAERWKSEEEGNSEREYEGRKIEPDCGRAFTFEELRAEFGEQFCEADLRSYWRKEMTRAEN